MSEVVKNAADEDQVRADKKNGKYARDKELNDLRFLMSNIQGRRFLWRLLGRFRVYGSCLNPSGSMVYYNIGQQDAGHFIQSEIVEADQDKYFEMLKEAKEGKFK